MTQPRPRPGWIAALPLRFWPVMLLVLAVLLILAILGRDVFNRLDKARDAQSENTTWLVAQIEVDALKLLVALHEAEAGGSLEDLRQSHDIFLSRMGVIENYMAESAVLGPVAEGEDWQMVLRCAEAVRRVLDVPDSVLVPRLAEARAEVETMRAPLRRFTIAALTALVDAGIRAREGLAMLLTRSAELGLTVIVLLTGSLGLMVYLARRLRERNREVEATRANLERTLATTFDGVIVARPDGQITDANPAALTLFGRDHAAMTGCNLSALLTAGSGEGADLVGAVAQGALPAPRVAVTGRHAAGHGLALELSLTAGQDGQGAEMRFAFLRDVSDRHRHEESLRAARDAALRAAEAKTRFLAVMSHEMRTPLNGVIAALDLLARTTRPSKRQAGFLALAEASAGVALDQINDVLEQARLDEAASPELPETVDLLALIEDLVAQVRPLAGQGGNRILLNLPPGPSLWLLLPRRGVTRVMMNLLGNAAKFTHDGTITVSARLSNPVGAPPLLSIEVADTGIGIPSDQIEAVFEPFARLEDGYDRGAGGTGLGLGIARRAAERMGGRISVDSTPGQGCRFCLEIPVLAAEPPLPLPKDDLRPEAPLPRQSILIAEDHPTNRLVLREMLTYLGQNVTEACDGTEALTLAQAQPFDLILMDISMPGLDGVAVTQAIRAGAGPSSGARIIALTAHGLPEELAKFRAGGLDDVVQKPITLAVLRPLLHGGALSPALDGAVIGDLERLMSVKDLQAAVASLRAEACRFAQSLRDPAAPDLAAMAHRLAGAAALFGATDLMALLRQPPAGPCYAAAFDVVWRRADQALSDWLSRIGA